MLVNQTVLGAVFYDIVIILRDRLRLGLEELAGVWKTPLLGDTT